MKLIYEVLNCVCPDMCEDLVASICNGFLYSCVVYQ